jgi:hypothetical protein
VTAPTRIVYAARNAYRLDPYVRDAAGKFAPHPAEPLAPLELLEASADRIDLSGGNGVAWTCGPETGCHYRVRTIREEDGSFRIIYLEETA